MSAVNGILRIFLQGARMKSSRGSGGGMVFKAFYEIWNRRSSKLEREQKLAQERLRQRQTEEDKERAERQETTDLVIAVLVSEDYRHFYEEFSNDLEDAKAAARMAYKKAAAEGQQAAETLARVQENALVLADSQRVYLRGGGYDIPPGT